MVSGLDAIDWPVRTERLSIRRPRLDDFDQTWAFRGLPEVSRWTSRAHLSREQHRLDYERPEWLAVTVVVELHGRIEGWADGYAYALLAEEWG